MLSTTTVFQRVSTVMPKFFTIFCAFCHKPSYEKSVAYFSCYSGYQIPVVDVKLRYLLKFYSFIFLPSETKKIFQKTEFKKPNKKHEQKMLSVTCVLKLYFLVVFDKMISRSTWNIFVRILARKPKVTNCPKKKLKKLKLTSQSCST